MAGNALDRLADYYDPNLRHTVPPPAPGLPSYQPVAPPPPPQVAPPPAAVNQTPPAKRSYTPDEWTNMLLSDPRYQQPMEWLTDDYNTALRRAGEMSGLDEQRFQQALSSIGAGGGYTVPASFYEQLALQKEKAAHDKALADEALPFMLGARGMRESGQFGFEQGELAYDYDTLLKEIDLTRKGREDEVAQANARQAAADAAQRANMMISRQIDLKQDAYRLEDLRTDYARSKGDLLLKVANYYTDYYWDAESGMYRPA